jgi:hypothetical protein
MEREVPRMKEQPTPTEELWIEAFMCAHPACFPSSASDRVRGKSSGWNRNKINTRVFPPSQGPWANPSCWEWRGLWNKTSEKQSSHLLFVDISGRFLQSKVYSWLWPECFPLLVGYELFGSLPVTPQPWRGFNQQQIKWCLCMTA